ncbi:MAG: sigma-70 family RNA polymerase sigma factor [Candidatus Izemoplasmataceae bacterium]
MHAFPKHNDYEIISLIKEGDETAFSLMVEKYTRFIAKKIHKYNLAYEFDDLHQEGLIILYKSVITFDEAFNKTFTKYFELNYERYLISFIRTLSSRTNTKVHHYNEIKENNHCIHENSAYYYLHLDEIKKVLTDLEYRVYILREIKNYDIEFIAKRLKISVKSVYNSFHRAKLKIKLHFKE